MPYDINSPDFPQPPVQAINPPVNSVSETMQELMVSNPMPTEQPIEIKTGSGLTPEKEKEIITLVLNNKQECFNYLQSTGFYDQCSEYHDIYRNIPPKKSEKWMSNTFVPLTNPKVEAAKSNILNMLFSENPPIDIKVKQFSGGDEFHAGLIKTILGSQITANGFLCKFVDFLTNLLTYPVSFGFVGWDYRDKVVKVKQKKYEPLISMFGFNIGKRFSGYDMKPVNSVANDSPCFESLPIWDCFWDCMESEFDNSWFIYRQYISRDKLKNDMKSADNPSGKYNDNVNQIKKEDGVNEIKDKVNVQASLSENQTFNITRSEGAEKIEVLKWFGKYDINGDGYLVNCVISVAAGKYLIQIDEEPVGYFDKPVVSGTYIRLPNEIKGVPLCELVTDLQHLLNENVNQRNDNIAFTLNAEKIFKKNSGLNLQKLKSRPGQTVGVEETSDVMWIRPPDVTQSNFAHCSEIERWMQEATSITKMTLGISSSGQGRTATTSSILEGNTEERFISTTKLIENMSFNRIIRMFWEMDYQFLTENQIAEMCGVDVTKIDLNKLRPDYYIYSSIGIKALNEKNQKVLKLLQLLNIADRFPFVKKDVIFRKIYSLMHIGDNPDEVMYTDEEMAQLMKNAMALGLPPFGAGQPGQEGAPKSGAVGNESTQFNGTQIQTPGVPPTAEMNVPPQNMRT